MTTVLTKEQQEAEVAKRLFDSMGKITESVDVFTERVKTLEKSVEAFKDIDPKSIMEKMDKLGSTMDRVKRQIATNTSHGMYLSGLEDDAPKFSLVRACLGVKLGGTKEAFEKVKAGFEWEVVSQIREAASKAGHVVGVNSDGGFFVPDQVLADVIAAIYTRSVFVNLDGEGQSRVSVVDGLVGMPVKIPRFEGGMIAYWIGEEDEYALTKAQVGAISMSPHKLGVLTSLTNEMRRFGSFGFEQLLRRDMVRALAKKLDWSVMYGPGTDNAPRGLVYQDDIQVYRAENGIVYSSLASARAAANWAGGIANFDTIDEMRGALEDADIGVDDGSGGSFTTVSAPRWFRRLRQLKIENYSGQTAGQPYLLGAPMIKESTLRELIGEFAKSTQIRSTNTAGKSIGATASGSGTSAHFGDIVAGNLSELVLGRWSGIEIEDDSGKGTGFVTDTTHIKMRMYADLGNRQPKAIVLCPDARMRDA